MPLPIPNLDDRRFDDLVTELRARMATHLPELTQIAPGDPAHTFIDLFAYLTESILFRANLIPERQRRAVLNLLQIPVRQAQPSRGVVCIDAGSRSLNLSPLVRDGVQLKAGDGNFTGIGELQPTPLALTVSIKQKLSDSDLSDMGLSLDDLREQYQFKRGDDPLPFKPHAYTTGKETLSLAETIDGRFYLSFSAPKPLLPEIENLRKNLAGITLNIAISPADDSEADEIDSLTPRKFVWELLSRDEEGNVLALPLEILYDSSRGARKTGVVRLRLPTNQGLFDAFGVDDPMFSGLGEFPPELPEPLTSESVAFWIRLSCEDEPELELGYLGVNGIDVIGQGLKQDKVIGVGTGNPDQVVNLSDTMINPDSLVLDVEEEGTWVTWQRVDFLLDQGGEARVYRLDPVSGYVYFGDGLEAGKRPPAGKRIRVASYLHGGGVAGNIQANEIKELASGSSRLKVRQEWPFSGGIDAETVAQAERRIPKFLTHRNRAVTAQDFKILAENNPVNPVARAEVIDGFIPGVNINAIRENVPGVVSVFVLPPRQPALRQTPKPTKGLLKDVFEYLLQRILIGTELYILSPEFIPVAVSVNVDVLDPETEQQTLQQVKTTLINYFWPLAPGGAKGNGWNMGVSVKVNEIFTQVARVAGVRSVKAISVFLKGNRGWRKLSSEELELEKYQLPELLGVSVGTADGEPGLPGGLEGVDGSGSGGSGQSVPAPVIPEVC